MDFSMNKLKDYIERPNSVITGSAVEIIHTLRDFPIFFGCVDTPKESDLVADMTWGIDPTSGAIQLTRLVPLEILYQEQHVDGTGPTWEKYYDDFADYVIQNNPKRVLEIGGGSGQLAHRSTQLDSNIKWTVVEPNPIINETSQINVISSFFESTLEIDGDIDTVVFSQVMEHAYDPRDFVNHIAKFLPVGGKVIFAYPQLTSWIDRKFTNAINFEHTILIDDFIEYLFIEQGFKIEKKDIYNDHSIFFVAVKQDKKKSNISLPNKYNEYKSLYLNFVKFHEALVKELNSKIESSTEPVYLFGAHIFATYLFSFGLNTNLSGILDNSKLKQNRRLYGTNFIVSSPKILKGLGRVNVILKAGVYNDEIKKDILENINPDVIFW